MLFKDEIIVSTYIDRPLLIKNKKFDMRMYVIVTSFHPLRAYLYQEGLARFATEDYSNDPSSIKNKFAHLTNFSINKKNANFVRNNNTRANSQHRLESNAGATNSNADEEDPEQESSSKWSLRFLRKYLQKMLKTDSDIFASCHDVITKTLISTEIHVVNELNKLGNRQRCCFEVYGFDIMWDDDLKPWVLEVNCLPSLSSSSMFDK